MSWAIMALAAIIPICLLPEGQTPRDIAKNSVGSVVLLEMNDAAGQPLSLGSGFFVAEGLIATNAHVIEGAESGTAKLVGTTQRMRILGTVATNRHADIVLLKVAGSASLLHLGPDKNPVLGDRVYVLGNPLGLEGTFSEGIVSGIRRVESDSIIQMTAPISPGSSGGPVIDADGSVIGIAVATFKDGQNLNLAIPISYVSKLLAGIRPEPVVQPIGRGRGETEGGQSIVDGIATRTESGVVATGFEYFDDGTGYEFKITNRLPTAISHIRVRIIYYDAFKSVMDFENVDFKDSIPAGLAKNISSSFNSYEPTSARRSQMYYIRHHDDGTDRTEADHFSGTGMKPRIELRVIGFRSEEPE
jgi:hypothetical protein